MDDLSQLPDRAGALEALQSRHAADLVFTRVGNLLIALNPHAQLAHLFSKEERLRYLQTLDRQLPPHIFEHGAPSRPTHA